MEPLIIENAKIFYRNFSGDPEKNFNNLSRTFAVGLDVDLANKLATDGWAVKFPENEDAMPFLKVEVSVGKFPSQVIQVMDRGGEYVFQNLNEETMGMLDFVELKNVDLVINPYQWTVLGNSGIKAYLKKGYFEIETDRFTEKYGI